MIVTDSRFRLRHHPHPQLRTQIERPHGNLELVWAIKREDSSRDWCIDHQHGQGFRHACRLACGMVLAKSGDGDEAFKEFALELTGPCDCFGPDN